MKLSRLSLEKSTTILFLLLSLFILRVVAQILVANDLAPYLPPMSEWQSGLLPYPLLRFFQILIIGLYGKVCFDLKTGQGFFFAIQEGVKEKLKFIGILYFISMILRYIIYMVLCPEARWLSGTIPIIFHFVLASFIIIYGNTRIPAKTRDS